MTQFRGIRTLTSGEIQSAKRKVDMSDTIALLNPTAAPLTVLLKKTQKKESSGYKFEWMEDDIPATWDKVNSAYTAADGAVNVATKEKFVVGTIFQIITTKTVFRVTAVTGTGAGTITTETAPFGETADANAAVGDPIKILGTAYQSGATYPESISTVESAQFNYTQIFMTTVEVGQEEANMDLYGGDERAYQRNLKGIAHIADIERAFWFGERELQTATETPAKQVHTTRGVLTWITTNVSSVGTLTESEWETWLAKAFTYDSDSPRTVFASSIVMQALNFWGRGKIQMRPEDKLYGIQLSRYLSTHGEVFIAPTHRLFDKDPDAAVTGYSGHAVALRMKDLTYRYVRNSDTKLFEDVKDDHYGVKDVYVTNCGLELKLEKMQAELTDVTGYA